MLKAMRIGASGDEAIDSRQKQTALRQPIQTGKFTAACPEDLLNPSLTDWSNEPYTTTLSSMADNPERQVQILWRNVCRAVNKDFSAQQIC